MSDYFLLLPGFVEISVLTANSVDPDQPPTSDLSLHCLSMSLLWDTGRKWIKQICSHFLPSTVLLGHLLMFLHFNE